MLPVIYDALKQKPAILSATFEIEYSTYDERPTTRMHRNNITDRIYDSEKKKKSLVFVIYNLVGLYF
jgi:hypothetical protein